MVSKRCFRVCGWPGARLPPKPDYGGAARIAPMQVYKIGAGRCRSWLLKIAVGIRDRGSLRYSSARENRRDAWYSSTASIEQMSQDHSRSHSHRVARNMRSENRDFSNAGVRKTRKRLKRGLQNQPRNKMAAQKTLGAGIWRGENSWFHRVARAIG